MKRINVNGQQFEVDVNAATPLLWVLREQLKLTGTKFGCGMAQCGACTVHLDGHPIRSCVTPLSAALGKTVHTIESLRQKDGTLHALQQAWLAEQVPQCGYCQSGQLMSAAALLAQNSQPDDEAINEAMAGNICRCGMYGRIRRAIKSAAQQLNAGKMAEHPAGSDQGAPSAGEQQTPLQESEHG